MEKVAVDVLRGEVISIVDGDRFDLQVTKVLDGDHDQYDEVERVRIESLSVEQEGALPIDIAESGETEKDFGDTYLDVGGEEIIRTPEESAMEEGAPNPFVFYGVRPKEELEERLLGRTVRCSVKFRNEFEELEAEVTVEE